MKYEITFFKTIFDNDASHSLVFDEWSSMENFLYRASKYPGFKPKRGQPIPPNKKPTLLISPASYGEQKLRRNANVLHWSWCALDVDDHKFSADKPLIDQIVDLVGDYHFILSSTASSRKEHPKFRLIFPLKDYVYAEKIPDFWFAIQSLIGAQGDEQTKDLSRMFYAPATYEDAFHFFTIHQGQHIDPDALMTKYPNINKKPKTFMERLPMDVKKMMVEFKRNQSSALFEYSWTNYKDCPFVNKKMIDDFNASASIDNSGRYFKLYKIMCSIAMNAIDKKYPITPSEISDLANQIDLDNGARYQGWRDINKEAEHAVEYAYTKS